MTSNNTTESTSVNISKILQSQQEHIEILQNYIGELHSSNITIMESLHSIIKPIIKENEDLRKRIKEIERKQ